MMLCGSYAISDFSERAVRIHKACNYAVCINITSGSGSSLVHGKSTVSTIRFYIVCSCAADSMVQSVVFIAYVYRSSAVFRICLDDVNQSVMEVRFFSNGKLGRTSFAPVVPVLYFQS